MFKTKKASIFLKKINATFFLVKQLIVYPSHLVNHLKIVYLHYMFYVTFIMWRNKFIAISEILNLCSVNDRKYFFFFIFCLIANLRSLFQQQFGTYGLSDFWKMGRLQIVWKRLNGCRTFLVNHLHSSVGCSNILSKPNIINLN